MKREEGTHWLARDSFEPLIPMNYREASCRKDVANQMLAATQLQFDEIEAEVAEILDTLGNGHALYLSLGHRDRRTMNRSVFERLWISEDRVVGANLAPGYAHVAQDDLELRLARETKLIQQGAVSSLVSGNASAEAREYGYERPARVDKSGVSDEELEAWLALELGFSGAERPYGLLAQERTNPGAFRRQGSNEFLLVGVRGLEPPASASQTRRASQLRHTPSSMCKTRVILL